MKLKNKNYLIFLLVFLGLVLPIYRAKAFIFALATLIVSYLLSAIVTFILLLTSGFLKISIFLFTMVQSPDFISWSFTGPDNPIVDVGWTLTRDLMNMLFIIVLAFVGLATALRLNEYAYQKIIPSLVFIALIMNFTPVICGAIIDASNVLSNFFLGQYSGTEFFNRIVSIETTKIFNAFGTSFFDPIARIQRALQALLIGIFNVSAGAVYGLFAFLFLFRYIALWLLVILSPVAFFSYILPQTKRFWTQWWNWFLQWCFIGVTAGFFLYLANHMLLNAEYMVYVGRVNTPPELDNFWLDFIQNLLPFAAAVGFLYIGLLLTLKSSAEGAKYAISAAQKTPGLVWRATKFGYRQTAGRALASQWGRERLKNLSESKASERWRRWMQTDRKGIGGALTKAAGALGLGLSTAGGAPVRWTARQLAAVGARARVQEKQRIQEEIKNLKNRFGEKGENYEEAIWEARSISPLNHIKRMAMTQYLAQTKGKKALDKLPDDYLSDALRKMNTYHPDGIMDIVKHRPDLIVRGKSLTSLGKTLKDNIIEQEDVEEIEKLGYDTTESVARAVFGKIVKAAKKQEDLSDNFLKQEMAQDSVVLFKPAGFHKQIYENRASEISEGITDARERVGAFRLMAQNPNLARRLVFDSTFQNIVGKKGINGLETIDDYRILKENLPYIRQLENKSLDELEKEKSVMGEVFDTNIKNLGTRGKKIARSFQTLTRKIKSINAEMKKTQRKLKNKSLGPEELEQLNREIERYNSELQKYSNQIKDLKREEKEVKESINAWQEKKEMVGRTIEYLKRVHGTVPRSSIPQASPGTSRPATTPPSPASPPVSEPTKNQRGGKAARNRRYWSRRKQKK